MGPEIIHYLPQKIDFLGTTVHMQTLYMSWLTMAIVIIIVAAATSQRKLIPSGVQNVVEMFIDWLGDLMEKNMGVEGRRMMTPFIITLFLYIFVGNELGMLPAVGVHFTSPTNDINVALGLSVMVAVLVYIIGVARHGLGYFKHLISPTPVMLPLNLLEDFARPITMAARLFGNILAGEILLVVLNRLTPWLVPDIWIGFSLVIGFLQALRERKILQMENALMVVASVLAAGLIGAGAALGAALGNSRVTSTTIECMARQPEQASNFQVTMFISVGLIESMPIIAIVIAIVLVFANPFVG